jgi:hypothetical protein
LQIEEFFYVIRDFFSRKSVEIELKHNLARKYHRS